MRVADKLSLSRIVTGWMAGATALLLYYEVLPDTAAKWAIVVLLSYGAVTDFFDGRVARAEAIREGGPSPHGGRLDAFSDKAEKLPVWAMYAFLHWIPAWLLLPVLFRDLVSDGYRQIMPATKDKGDADLAGKIKTWAQYSVLIGTPATMLAGWERHWPYALHLAFLSFLSAVTLWATVTYVRVKGPRAYAYLQQRRVRKPKRVKRPRAHVAPSTPSGVE